MDQIVLAYIPVPFARFAEFLCELCGKDFCHNHPLPSSPVTVTLELNQTLFHPRPQWQNPQSMSGWMMN